MKQDDADRYIDAFVVVFLVVCFAMLIWAVGMK